MAISDLDGNPITLAQAESMLTDLPVDLESAVKIPYIIKRDRLMKSGMWNKFNYSVQALKDAYYLTDWSNPQSHGLYLDHTNTHLQKYLGIQASDPERYIGEVRNLEWVGDELYGDVVIVDKPIAMKVHYALNTNQTVPFGYSPEFEGGDDGKNFKWLRYKGFSLVLSPAVDNNWIRSNKYNNSGIVNVYYNRKEDDNMEDKKPEVKEPVISEADKIYKAFATKYKEAHPDAEDYDVLSAFNKKMLEMKEPEPKPKEPEPKPKEPEPAPVPKPAPEPPAKAEPPKEDEHIKKINELEARNREVEAKLKELESVPDKKTAPAEPPAPSGDRPLSPDEAMIKYIQKEVLEE